MILVLRAFSVLRLWLAFWEYSWFNFLISSVCSFDICWILVWSTLISASFLWIWRAKSWICLDWSKLVPKPLPPLLSSLLESVKNFSEEGWSGLLWARIEVSSTWTFSDFLHFFFLHFRVGLDYIVVMEYYQLGFWKVSERLLATKSFRSRYLFRWVWVVPQVAGFCPGWKIH